MTDGLENMVKLAVSTFRSQSASTHTFPLSGNIANETGSIAQ